MLHVTFVEYTMPDGSNANIILCYYYNEENTGKSILLKQPDFCEVLLEFRRAFVPGIKPNSNTCNLLSSDIADISAL